MVAVIHTSNSLRAVLNYNENKVTQDKAVCLAAENYPKDAIDLTFNQKLNLLQKQASLNLRTKVNSVHISLNFDPSERHGPDQLRAIAGSYMDKIGFGQQPYLIYEHSDAGHPHIHVLTTNIEADGSRIPLHNLGKNQSEKARKQIEIDFNLVKAEGRNQQKNTIKPVMIKASYGKMQTKNAISNVLNVVVNDYKYGSLPELNAVLKQYNVQADRCSEQSRTYQQGGLLYSVLDEKGNSVGVPIKASDFYQKPTLQNLGKRFEINEQARQQYKGRVKNAIDLTLLSHSPLTVADLQLILKQEGIDTVCRVNEHGVMYGITYVDHQTMCVFNGSSLGKSYSAKAIQQRCVHVESYQRQGHDKGRNMSKGATYGHDFGVSEKFLSQNGSPTFATMSDENLTDTLFDPLKQDGYTPYQLRKSRKKKQKSFGHQL